MDSQLVTIHAICFIVTWIDFIINCVRTVVIFTQLTMSFNTEHMAHVNAGNTETSCNCGEKHNPSPCETKAKKTIHYHQAPGQPQISGNV